MLSEHRFALGVALALLALAGSLFALMAFGAGEDFIQRIDDDWADLVEPLEWGPLTVGAWVLNILGGAWVTLPVRVGVGFWLYRKKRWEALWVWVVAVVSSEIAVGVLKSIYGRARPPDPLVSTTGFSFPSGHAVAGAVTVIALVIVLVPAGPRRRNLEVIAGYFAFFMAGSRVYLRAHWLSDVVAGTALGAAMAIGIAALTHEFGDYLYRRRVRGALDALHSADAPSEPDD